jgi:hypothetical protein
MINFYLIPKRTEAPPALTAALIFRGVGVYLCARIGAAVTS